MSETTDGPIDDATLASLRAELLARDPLFLGLFASAEDLVLLHVGERVLLANEAAARALGVDSTERLFGVRMRDVAEGEALAGMQARARAVEREGRSVGRAVHRMRRLDGRGSFDAEYTSFPFPFAGRTLTLTLGRDATDQLATERALAEREAQLRAAERLAHVGSWSLDLENGALAWTEEMYRIFEADPRERPSFATFLERVHPADLARVKALSERPAEMVAPREFAHRLQMPDGRVKHVLVRRESRCDDDGRPILSVGTVQDLTARVEAELRRQRQSALLAALLDASSDAIFAKDLEHRFLVSNPAHARVHGRKVAEIVGRKDQELLSVERLERDPALRDADREAFAGRASRERFTLGGRTYDAIKGPLRNDAGEIIGVFGYSRDVTEQREAERRRDASDARFRAAFEQAAVGMVLCDPAGRIELVNGRFREIVGRAAGELERRAFASLVVDDAAGRFAERLAELGSGRADAWSTEASFARGAAGAVRASVTASVRRDQGRVAQLLFAVEDISARKAAEAGLARSQEMLALFLRATTDQLCLFSVLPDGQLRYEVVNDAWLRWARTMCPELQLEGVIGNDRASVLLRLGFAAPAVAETTRLIAEMLESKSPVTGEYAATTPQGAPLSIEVHALPVLDEAGACTHVVWSARVVTERKRVEGEIRRLQRSLLGAERLARAGSWQWDLGPPRTLRWSPGMYRLHGLDPAEPLTLERVLASIHEDDRARIRASVLGGALRGRWEYRVRLADGGVRLLRAESESERDADDRAVVIGFAQDVTEQRAAEERIAAQLEEKKVLLKEIHHRVKNNMQVVSSLLHLQERRASPEAAAILRDNGARIAALALVHEKLYSSEHLARVDLAVYVEDLARSIFRSLEVEPTRVSLEVRGGGVWLDADRIVPCGLLLNEILFNSLKHAFPDGRRGAIVVDVRATAEEFVLEVRDDGCGLPATEPSASTATKRPTLGRELLRRLPAQARGTLEPLPGPGVGYRLVLARHLPIDAGG